MPDDHAHEPYRGSPMGNPANLETALPTEEEECDEALVVAKGESRNHQDDEGDREQRVLDDLVGSVRCV